MSYKVVITVASVEGECAAGHKVGDSWVVQEDKTPDGLCIWAYAALAPYVVTLAYGGEFPWAEDKDVIRSVCSDPENPVVFELKRIES